MRRFAKLFETKEHGQIVVLRTVNDKEKPCVNIMFELQDGVIVTTTFDYDDTEDGFNKTIKLFELIGQENAVQHVNAIKEKYSIIPVEADE
ncbi:MAG: hypothetical protein JXA07_04040 [Spirochaetes bacterium]|nr:hypothetical protein [Spirochaetota bacterium]